MLVEDGELPGDGVDTGEEVLGGNVLQGDLS